FLGSADADSAIATKINTAGSSTANALSASIVGTALPRWKASTAYAAGDTVLAPDGSVVKAVASFTSGATYDSTKWTSVAAATGTQAANEMAATYATRADTVRQLFQRIPKVPLHPTPPTVTLGAGGAASGIPSSVAIPASNAALRYTCCNGTTTGGAGGWYTLGNTPNSSTLDQGQPYAVDFMINTQDFEIRLAGQSASRGYRLWVDGQPLTEDVQPGPGASGTGHYLRLTFTTRRSRHIRILTSAGIVTADALRIAPDDSVWASTAPLYTRRAYFLGDSFTAGSSADYSFGYPYFLSELFGWEVLNGGEAGTGYLNPGSGGGRTTYPARANTDLPAGVDVVVVYGGTNDRSYAGTDADMQNAAATTYANLATKAPKVPVFVFGVQYPSGAADTVRDGRDNAIAAAAAAAPNVAGFFSVKSWVSGTGKAGTARSFSDASLSSGFTSINSATAAFTAADVGLVVTGPGIPAYAKIASVSSATTAAMTVAATASGTNVTVSITNQKADGNADVVTSSDALHPTTVGHRLIANRMAHAMFPKYATV
ncbi:MAG: hypothetical protein HOV66_16615, partial [Streptomycetaceae bacterium]|nr:hypothetical protein [Streptomycetaceae bacterium]